MLRFLAPALAAAALLAPFLPAAPPQDSGIRWHTDKKKAFDEARRTGKPLWIVFR